jgi:hypothetical protein
MAQGDGVPFDDFVRQFVLRETCFEGTDEGVSAWFDLKVGLCASPGHGGSMTQREGDRVALPSVFGTMASSTRCLRSRPGQCVDRPIQVPGVIKYSYDCRHFGQLICKRNDLRAPQ